MTKFKQLGISTVGLILVIVVLLLLFGALPSVGFVNYGWGPPGLFGLILIILIVALVLGRL